MEPNTTTNIGATEGVTAKPSFVDIEQLLAADAKPIFTTFTVNVMFDDEGNPKAGFEIVGKNSDQYQQAVRATSVTAIKRGQTKKQQIDGKTDEGANKLYDLGEDRQLKIATAVVVGLPGFGSNGQPLPVSGKIVTAMLTKFPDWVTKIHLALEADANFLTI